ncbi:putative membrane protein [Chlamydia psittaci 84-8471/1]|nr:putative membrane protein [Chlamydia psittaci 84-8471/1]
MIKPVMLTTIEKQKETSLCIAVGVLLISTAAMACIPSSML